MSYIADSADRSGGGSNSGVDIGSRSAPSTASAENAKVKKGFSG